MTNTVKLLNLAALIESKKYEAAYALIRELNRDRNLGMLWAEEENQLNIMMANLLDCAAKEAGWAKE